MHLCKYNRTVKSKEGVLQSELTIQKTFKHVLRIEKQYVKDGNDKNKEGTESFKAQLWPFVSLLWLIFIANIAGKGVIIQA